MTLDNENETTDLENLFIDSVEAEDPDTKRRLRKQVAEKDLESPYGLFSLAWLMADSRDYDYHRVLSLYSEAIKLKPDFWLARFERGNTAFDHNDLDAAIADYEYSIKAGVKEPNIFYNAALAYAKKGLFEEALAYYSDTIKLAPNHAPAYYGRAAIHIKHRDYDQAVSDLSEALNIQPDSVNYCVTRALAYANLSKFDDAIKDFSRAIELNPQDPKPYSYRGNIYMLVKDYNHSINDFHMVTRLRPDDWQAYEFLGMLMCFKNLLGEGLWCLRQSLSINPQNERAEQIIREENLGSLIPREPDWESFKQ